MAQQIVMPKLAMGMNEGTVATWRFATGDFVEKGAILLDLETEKVSYELEAYGAGYLRIMVEPGKTVPVDTLIAYLAESREELAALSGTGPGEIAGEQAAAPAGAQADAASAVARSERIAASPLAKKLAEQNGMDLATLTGSGPNGRIEKKDVEAAIAGRSSAPVVAPVTTPSVPLRTNEVGVNVKTSIPLKGLRKAISDNMMKSLNSAAQMSAAVEVDVTEIVRLRERLADKAETVGIRISYNDIIALILARAVRQVLVVNSSLVGDEIRVWDDINLGIAVATEISEYETGLFVPVVKNADRKSLFEISREIKELVTKARNGQLGADDMAGGTLTLSNAAFIGGLVGTTPILNPGQAVLIQPGAIIEKPAVRGGAIVIRSMMSLSVTWDHRILDGVPVGRLINKISELMECPELLL